MIRSLFVVVIACLAFTGCGQNYLAERDYWRAERKLRTADLSNLKERGGAELQPIMDQFEAIVDDYPSSPKAVESLFILSKLNIRLENHANAIDYLKRIIQNYSHNHQLAAEARYRIAEIYEYQGNWAKAEEAFWELADFHPLASKGMFAPVHVLSHYKRLNDVAGQERTYARVLDFYDKRIKQLGPIQQAAGVKNMLALTHLANGKWQEAEDTWLSVVNEFSNSEVAPMSLLAAAELAWSKKNYGDAEIYYNRYFDEYPKHALSARTAQQLATLYFNRKEYVSAEQWAQKALSFMRETKTDNPERVAQVHLFIGRAKQMRKEFDDAIEIFTKLLDEQPSALATFQAPIFLAQIYTEKQDSQNKEKVLNDGLAFYKKVQETSKDPKRIALSKQLQNAALADLGNWEEVIKNFQDYMHSEKTMDNKGDWLFAQALITDREINDGEEAAHLYKKFFQEYPDHPLAPSAKTRQELLLKASN